jgi:hypothetical protein
VRERDVFVHDVGLQTFRSLKIDYAKLLKENKQKFLDKWKDFVHAR